MLSGSRTLFGMASHGHAPRIFKRINRLGVPYVAVSLFALFVCLSYMTVSDSASTVFTWLQDIVSIATLVNWVCISVTYLHFYYACRRQGINRHEELPWASPFQPYCTWITLVMLIILFFTGGWKTFTHHHWDTETFISSYLNLPVIVILYFGYKFIMRTKIVPLDQVPIRPFIEDARLHPEFVERPRGWRRLNILWS